MLFACAISPDGRHLATGDKVGHITVWDLESGRKLAALEAPELYTWDPVQRHHSIGGIRSLAFSPDGTRLAVGGSGKISNIDHLDGKARVEVFDWQKGERTHEFASDKFKGLVEYLGFHPQGDWLLAAGGGDKDGFLTFFDLAAKKVLAQEKAPMYVHDLALERERRHDLCRRTSQDRGPRHERRLAGCRVDIWHLTSKPPRTFPARISTGVPIGRSASRAPPRWRVIRARFGCGTGRREMGAPAKQMTPG